MSVIFRRVLFIAAFVFITGTIRVVAQTTGDYRVSIGFLGTEQWSDRTIWERYNGVTWVTPTVGQGYPGLNVSPGRVSLVYGGGFDFLGTLNLDVSPAFAIGNVEVLGVGMTLQTQGNQTLTITNTLTVNGSGTFTFGGTGSLSVGGATTIDGTFTDSNAGGITRFTGLLTVTGTWTSTAVIANTNMNFRGGINNTGTVNGGAASFTIGNQILSGTGDITFTRDIAITAVTVTNSNTGDLVVGTTTALATSGGFTDNNAGGTNTFVGAVTIPTGTTFNTVVSTAFGNLIFQGGITNNGVFNAGGATFNTNNQALAGNNAYSFANDIQITGVVLTASTGQAVTIGGTTTLSNAGGGFTDTDGSQATIFGGLLTVNNGTTFTSTAVTNSPYDKMVFRGGITNNGTFNAGSGLFNTGNSILSGASTITFNERVTVTGVTVTNNNTSAVTLAGVNNQQLDGTGNWTQGINGVLNFFGQSITLGGTFTASAINNTVNYNRTNTQTIFNGAASTYYNLTLSNSNTKTLSANTIALGDILISNTAIFSLVNGGNNYTLSVGGDWTNSSTNTDPLTEGTGAITFNGNAAQTISNTGNANGTSFNNLILNNTFATIPQITISNTTVAKTGLTMTDGVVNLSTTTFTLGTSIGAPGTLSHAGGAANGWFYNGTLNRYVNTGAIAAGGITGYFPVGGVSDFRPFSFSGTPTTGGQMSVRHVDATTSPDVNFADGAFTVRKRSDANWVVTNTGIAGAAAGFALRAQGTGFGTVGNVNDLRIVHASDATGMGSWVAASNGGTTTNPTINRSSLNAAQMAGTFYVGSVDPVNTPLPVELIFFNATLTNDEVFLTWRTATELNNDFFTIERAQNLEKFDPIGVVEGHGTTNQPHDYTLADPMPIFGRSYYRLKQTDFDGKSTYSNVVVVDYEGPRFTSLHAYPNPSNGQSVTIRITGLKEQTVVPIQIISTTGQIVYENTLEVETTGTLHQEVTFNHMLNQGVYIIRAGKTIQLTQKLFVE